MNHTIPQLGFGTWKLRNPRQTVLHALQTGYRHLDCADLYANHKAIGQAIRDSGLPRPDLFLTTKLMPKSHRSQEVTAAVQRFLDELQTDYLDLLLIHWPSQVPVAETLGAMDVARQAGFTRSLGVSNFDVRFLEKALQTGIAFSNNQIEYNLNEQPQAVLAFCLERNITVTSYTSLARGSTEQEALVASLAQKYGATREQLLLAWLMGKGMLVIPASSNPAHIESNFHSSQFMLDSQDLAALDAADLP